jgi:hypothetical protein
MAIDRERLRRWEIDFAHLAATLATALELVLLGHKM